MYYVDQYPIYTTYIHVVTPPYLAAHTVSKAGPKLVIGLTLLSPPIIYARAGNHVRIDQLMSLTR